MTLNAEAYGHFTARADGHARSRRGSLDGDWVMGVQRAPNHVAPDWPTGSQQQQVHIDLHVDDLEAAGRQAVEFGGRQLQAATRPSDNPDGDEMFAVYASPAGHPFCFGVH